MNRCGLRSGASELVGVRRVHSPLPDRAGDAPSTRDGWNGELYARDDATWGSNNPRTGSISLNRDLVLPYLIGRQWPGRQVEQTQALQAVLHEAYHQRVETDAPNEVTAFRGLASMALDEGLTEYVAKADVVAFGRRAGYGRLDAGRHAYPEAFHATVALLDYGVADDRGRDILAQRALDRPVVMRWDTIAAHIVKERLAPLIPTAPHHHLAARAEHVRAMAHAAWDDLEIGSAPAGQVAAHHTTERLNRAVLALRGHYRRTSDKPFPGAPPNPNATRSAGGSTERQRRSGPPAQRRTRGVVSGATSADVALSKALLGTAAAAGATRRPTPRSLSGRARRAGPGHTHPGPNRPRDRQ